MQRCWQTIGKRAACTHLRRCWGCKWWFCAQPASYICATGSSFAALTFPVLTHIAYGFTRRAYQSVWWTGLAWKPLYLTPALTLLTGGRSDSYYSAESPGQIGNGALKRAGLRHRKATSVQTHIRLLVTFCRGKSQLYRQSDGTRKRTDGLSGVRFMDERKWWGPKESS